MRFFLFVLLLLYVIVSVSVQDSNVIRHIDIANQWLGMLVSTGFLVLAMLVRGIEIPKRRYRQVASGFASVAALVALMITMVATVAGSEQPALTFVSGVAFFCAAGAAISVVTYQLGRTAFYVSSGLGSVLVWISVMVSASVVTT